MTLPIVVFPLFERPVRAALPLGREVRPDQLRTLAASVPQHLHNLVPIVEILKRAGWEVLAQETALICRHPSVRTQAIAEVALCQLGIDVGWYRTYDAAEIDRLFPSIVEEEALPLPRPGGMIGRRDVSLFEQKENLSRDQRGRSR
jgi:hypothetical protein